MAQYYLGIDGGGTGCRVRLRDTEGRLLGEGTGGAANVHQDFAGSVRSILAAAQAAVEAAGLPGGAMREMHAGMGLAGIISSQGESKLQEAGLPFAAITAINDAHAACLGAHRGEDGGIVICGTGSAAFAIVGGRQYAIGGWGFELGDDGSGAMMGREAVRCAVLSIDGLGKTTPLTEHVLAELGRGQPGLTAWARKAKPGDYARFAPDILRFASGGDPIADGIVRKAVGAVFDLAHRLQALGAPRLSLFGSLGAALSHDREEFRQTFTAPLADACDGAIMAARQAAGLAMLSGGPS